MTTRHRTLREQVNLPEDADHRLGTRQECPHAHIVGITTDEATVVGPEAPLRAADTLGVKTACYCTNQYLLLTHTQTTTNTQAISS